MLFNHLPFSNPHSILPMGIGTQQAAQPQPIEQPPEANLARVIHYNADYSGCGMYRMSWVGHLLNAHQKITAILYVIRFFYLSLIQYHKKYFSFFLK